MNTYLVSQVHSTLLMMSIIGYCLFPFVVAAFLNLVLRKILGFIGVVSSDQIAVASGFAYFWSLKSASLFLGNSINEKRKYMALYPLALYYLFFAFYVLLTI